MTEQGLALNLDKYGLKVGTPDIKSVGPLAFGPEGILFVADNAGATIFAIAIGDADVTREPRPLDIDKIDTRLAAYLGCSREDVFIRDMAAHPSSQNVYLSVMRGSGTAGIPLLIKIGADGALSEVRLEDVPFARTAIENAPADDDERLDTRLSQDQREGELRERDGVRYRVARDKLRTATVTDMAYVDGLVMIAGASNEEFSSTLRRIPFPFAGSPLTNSLEIFHVSHGKYETASPIRTFVPYGGNASILASYTCTPVVHFSLKDIKAGTQVKGRTVAELGAGNTPIDMVSYLRDGQEYLLVSNARHPLMKIACKDIEQQEPLTQPQEPVGVPRERLPHKGVGRMANLNGSYVLMMHQDETGNIDPCSYSTSPL